MKAIITKYALTSGVQVLEGEEHGKSTFRQHYHLGGWANYFHGSDWHKDKQAALRQLVSMLQKRRASLQKQLADLDDKYVKAMKAIEAAEL